uniref:RCC1-like domain-containing protein n=1 Tax=Kalanchoe fedtschenkoi TaxID=63787 RepID=A0A7N0RI69_KALFE
MEGTASSQIQKPNSQTSSRKHLPLAARKDLWLVVHEGSLSDVESALLFLKKNGGNINSRNIFGLTPLHIAVWRNHIPIVRRLLAAGADTDARDGESAWSSLHRALHFGHLVVAATLLQSGASVTVEDSKFRTPVDLLSGPVLQAFGDNHDAVATEVYSWGSGTNYQLGTGNAHIQKLPCKVDSLHDSVIKIVAAAKFHSVAISSCGEVYTWGFGRGGRLGHPEFDIHSGQAAVITPRQVTSGLGSRRVKAVAAAKHHTVISTEGGEVFTWGSNREGQLGYTSVDTQPTPRRVSSIRSKIVAVAAANKHTAAVSESGEVFTWGCNEDGQLGYGTSNSASNYTPRVVEYLKGKVFAKVAAAKYHTIALGTEGEVYTWGHKLVTPKRVIVSRNMKKSGSSLLKFHRSEKLHVSEIAAGMVHSLALTDDGALFYWISSDPNLKCRQLYSICGKKLVSISAGKYWATAVTTTGDLYMWDGKRSKDNPPIAVRLHGVKKATAVSAGETHLLAISSLYHPSYSSSKAGNPHKPKATNEVKELDDDFMYESEEADSVFSSVRSDDLYNKEAPSLKSLCEKVAAECIVEPRNAIQILEIADSLGADDLKKYCEDIAIRNIDYILAVASPSFASTSLEILANLEKVMDLRSSESWSHRRLPTPTATLPAIINSEEDDCDGEFLMMRDKHMKKSLKTEVEQRSDSFLSANNGENQDICKHIRALRKKLQQIEMLELKMSSGQSLDDQQIAKLQTRSVLESSLAGLGVPAGTPLVRTSSSGSGDGRSSKKVRQRRNSKQRSAQVTSFDSETDATRTPVKGCMDIKPLDTKTKKTLIEEPGEKSSVENTFPVVPKKNLELSKPKAAKKKNKKGGLSMFLSGALDDIPEKVAPPPPPTPKNESPAWGGTKIVEGSTSLRVILDEQSKIKGNEPARFKIHSGEPVDDRSGNKISLSSFLHSKPVLVASGHSNQISDGDKSTPPWTASGTPPISRPSLRDIQMQQREKQQTLSHSPKTKTAGFSVTSGQGTPSPSSSSEPNRWFKPDFDATSSIRSIQIEEKAMKDLKRFYSNVKLVKNKL